MASKVISGTGKISLDSARFLACACHYVYRFSARVRKRAPAVVGQNCKLLHCIEKDIIFSVNSVCQISPGPYFLKRGRRCINEISPSKLTALFPDLRRYPHPQPALLWQVLHEFFRRSKARVAVPVFRCVLMPSVAIAHSV